MQNTLSIPQSKQTLLILCWLCFLQITLCFAATRNISDSPLAVTVETPPLTMLVMGNDHRLFYEAYNDSSDLNDDGQLDLHYKPNIDYYGYFNSHLCYSYSNNKKRFNPSSVAIQKKCAGQWSGDWLNWMTMTRMDIMRKALFGGYRSEDTTRRTVLKRADIVQDAHSWGKEYTNPTVDGYDISDYTPLSQPSTGKRHLFANTTLFNNSDNHGRIVDQPLLRVLQNSSARIWEWVSRERPVAGQKIDGISGTVNPTDYVVQVRVCRPNIGLADNCKLYPSGHYKPTGLLHEFGENGAMKFGLMSKSYEKNLSGGVLRKNIEDFANEIDAATGQFLSSVNGIVNTINKYALTGFNSNYTYEGGWVINRPPNEGEFKNWGNPIAEMMYETLRYFAGKGSATPAFDYSSGVDASLGLPKPSWKNPYANNPYCAKPNMLVISDIYNSYDSDSVPGSYFNSFNSDIGINAASLGQTIWSQEFAGHRNIFIGQSKTVNDGAPSVKNVSSFGNIRGLVPEEPSKQGSYYPASIAYYGWKNDISTAQDTQKLQTFVVALGSPLRPINIPVRGKLITVIPFAKTVGGCSINGEIDSSPSGYQPTNQIVDFYIKNLTTNSGEVRVNFEDMQQGADHDMDAIVTYSYFVNDDGQVTISLSSDYAAGCLIQHMGYVISGTTADGTYLEVRDLDTSSADDVIYHLDTPPFQLPGQRDNVTKLPLSTSRVFTPSNNASASFLPAPLYYAAKWGSFTDVNNNQLPDLTEEWDKNNDGIPDNFFKANNPGSLITQLKAALLKISDRPSSLSSAATNSGTLNTLSRLYQTRFNGGDWSGQLLAFALNPQNGQVETSGSASNGAIWDAATQLDNQNFDTGRVILTYNAQSKRGLAFRWPNNPSNLSSSDIDNYQLTVLNTNPISNRSDNLGKQRLNYLRGDRGAEKQNGGNFRNRSSVLGDIVHSTPQFVGAPGLHYRDTLESAAYSQFKIAKQSRLAMIYVGANDGSLHGFNAQTGEELLAYFPHAAFTAVNQLTNPDYSHRFFVDGSPNVMDAFINNQWRTILVGGLNHGGRGIYALDVTNPTDFSESKAESLVLWEFTATEDADLGYTYSQPAIVRQANGKWVAIFGNGFNNTHTRTHEAVSSTGNAVLYVVDLANGELIQKLDTGVGMQQDPTGKFLPNGLATPTVVDLNNDNNADLIYAGDLFGNLWKFYWDSNTNRFKIATFGGNDPAPFFTAKDANGIAQPITSQANILRNKGKLQIFFGTGQFFEVGDNNPSGATPQSFYSLIDTLNTSSSTGKISSRSELLQQSIVANSINSGFNVRVTSNHALLPSQRGWFLDLIEPNGNVLGERVTTSPILRNGRVIFVTVSPSSDPCRFGGSSWLMEMNALSGRRLQAPSFDLNQDGKFDSKDQVTINGHSMTISGLQSADGLLSSPIILDAFDREYKYSSTSNGTITTLTENPGTRTPGRQSWHEIH